MQSLIFQIFIGSSNIFQEMNRVIKQASKAHIAIFPIQELYYQCSFEGNSFLFVPTPQGEIVQPIEPLKMKIDVDGKVGLDLAFYAQRGLDMLRGYEIIKLETKDLCVWIPDNK